MPSRRPPRAPACPLRRIGRIEAGESLRLVDRGGEGIASQFGSFDHFRA